MDTVKVDNETELTSTMGNILSTSINDEKSDTGDATPTSSTDASTTTISSQIVSDDPISSTSSDVMEQMKPKTSASSMNKSSEEDVKVTSMDQEADLLEMSMTDVTVSNEKITEDVEDLVHDLESLLGESTELYNTPMKQKKDTTATRLKTLAIDTVSENDIDKELVSLKPETTVKVSTENKDNDNVEREESLSTHKPCLESAEIGKNVESPKNRETEDPDAKIGIVVEESRNSPEENVDNTVNGECKKVLEEYDEVTENDDNKTSNIPETCTLNDEKYEVLVEDTDNSDITKVEEVIPAISELLETSTHSSSPQKELSESVDDKSSDIPQEIIENHGNQDEIEKDAALPDLENKVEAQPNNLEQMVESNVQDESEPDTVEKESTVNDELTETVNCEVTAPTSVGIGGVQISCGKDETSLNDLEVRIEQPEKDSSEVEDATKTPTNSKADTKVELCKVEPFVSVEENTSETEEFNEGFVQTQDKTEVESVGNSVEVEAIEGNSEAKDQDNSDIVLFCNSDIPEENNPSIEDHGVQDNTEPVIVEEIQIILDDPKVETRDDSELETKGDVNLEVPDISETETVEDDVISSQVAEENVQENLQLQTVDDNKDQDISVVGIQNSLEDTPDPEMTQDNSTDEAVDDNPVEVINDKLEIETDQSSPFEIIQDQLEDAKVEDNNQVDGGENDQAVEVIKDNPQDEDQGSSEVTIPNSEVEIVQDEKVVHEIVSDQLHSDEPQFPIEAVPGDAEVEDISKIDVSPELSQLIDVRITEVENIENEKISSELHVIETNVLADESTGGSAKLCQEFGTAQQSKNEEMVIEDVASTNVISELEETHNKIQTITENIIDEGFREIVNIHTTTCQLTPESGTANNLPKELPEADRVDNLPESNITENLPEEFPQADEVVDLPEELPDAVEVDDLPEKLSQADKVDDPQQLSESNKVDNLAEKLQELDNVVDLPEELPEADKEVDDLQEKLSDAHKIDDTPIESNENIETAESIEIETEDTKIVTNINENESCTEVDQYKDNVGDAGIENTKTASVEEVDKHIITNSEMSIGEIEPEASEHIANLCCDISTVKTLVETEVNDALTNDVVSHDTDEVVTEVIDALSENGVETVEKLDDVIKKSLESCTTEQTLDANKDEIIEATNKLNPVTEEDTMNNVNILTENIVDSVAEDSDEEMVPILALEPEEECNIDKSNLEPILSSATGDPTDTMEEVSKSKEPLKESTKAVKRIQKVGATKKKSGNSKIVRPVDETLLAVANLEKIEALEIIDNVPPTLSEKERMEMEALRKAVESITGIADTAEIVYEVEDISKDVNIPEEVIEESVEINHILSKDCEKSDEIVESSIESENSKPTISDKQHVDNEIENDKTSLGTSPDSSQTIPESEFQNSIVNSKEESKIKTTDKPKRHRKTLSESKLEELSINVDVSGKDRAYSPKITIKPIKVPDEEVSTTSNLDSEVVKGSLKMTITKQSDKMHSILKICDPENSEPAQETEEHVPKLKIKPIVQPVEQHSPKMATRSSKHLYSPTSSVQRSSSPRITIKPVVKPEKQEPLNPLKIKIGVLKAEDKSTNKHGNKPIKLEEEAPKETILSPKKVIIKPIVKPLEESEPAHSPKITIKPIPKKESEKEMPAMTKLNIKLKKVDDEHVDTEKEKGRSSPKITIKPIVKPPEPESQTVEADEDGKGRIVLKINKGNLPISTKDSKKREHVIDEDKFEKVKINRGTLPLSTKESKKREHPVDDDKIEKLKISKSCLATSTKDFKKHSTDEDKAKLSKANVPTSTKDPKKREHSVDDDKSEKLAKITVKFSKGGGHPHIVQQTEETHKRTYEDPTPEKHKKQKIEAESSIATRTRHKEVPPVEVDDNKYKDAGVVSKQPDLDEPSKSNPNDQEVSLSESRVKLKDPLAETPIETKRTKEKEAEINSPSRNPGRFEEEDVKIVDGKLDSPIVISEDSRSQDSGSCVIVEESKDTPVVALAIQTTPEVAKSDPVKVDSTTSTPINTPAPIVPRKRGRPRKIPLQVREDFKDSEEASAEKKEQPKLPESGRPKRSCRGQSARDTLGIKPRKPRGPGRGRGSKRGMGSRGEPERDGKLGAVNFESMQGILQGGAVQTFGSSIVEEPQSVIAQHLQVVSPLNIEEKIDLPLVMPVSDPPPSNNPVLTETIVLPEPSGNPDVSATSSGPSEIVMVDEDTRMSADTNSRAQTPAKQMVAPADMAMVEESQSSIQSSATTESGKTPSSRSNKAPRLEVQEPEGSVISADQLTEYFWNGNGPFMLQEQVAQFLGIKSFKRKYPGIKRRMLEMQERDFIRESGLASEHMCDLGLTAVNSADILDIMYSDFQEKYEEYCKHQRDRQAKELINKQKALTLAASHEKSKADITDQAVQSAAQWNTVFNKARKEQRRACMDLQTLTVHYPKGKIKQIPKAKIGHYPVALVPGQFTDYYKEFTPTEINNLPLNTMLYDPINIVRPEDSDESGSDGSDSDSDSSSSSSASDSDSSSGIEDCKLCKHSGKKILPSK